MDMSEVEVPVGLTAMDRFLKRGFDVVFAALGLLLTGWLILLAFILATIDTRKNGFFRQERVGKDGKLFKVIKIRTMRDMPDVQTTVTSSGDPRITRLGRLWRSTKIDELPQLINILPGQMSFVGPRPDVPGFADELRGADRVILSVRPGITGPATLRFRHEEVLLASQVDPQRYNHDVIYPEKVRLNRAYVENYSFREDLVTLWRTVFSNE
jgi:lipopolysaccharide/colanic/teichoic acid biosynthesis glycosyltransferase